MWPKQRTLASSSNSPKVLLHSEDLSTLQHCPSYPLLPPLLPLKILFFKTVRIPLWSQIMYALRGSFTVVCCYDHIWGLESQEYSPAGCCVLMASLLVPLTLELPHLRATSRSPSSQGNENSNLRAQSRREDKSPPIEAQARQQSKGRKAERVSRDPPPAKGNQNKSDLNGLILTKIKTTIGEAGGKEPIV